LPKELQQYKEVFDPPPKGIIFDRHQANLNAYLPYDQEKVKKLPMMPHIKLDQQQEQALEEEFKELLQSKKITKVRASSASNVFNVPKKDGTFRTVFNFVMANNCLLPNKYPIPMILELVHRAASYKYHILLDLRNAYNQIYLEKRYRFLTNFRFKNETYQWNVLPFGLSTAPSIFQSILNLLLEKHLNKGIDIYLDDIHIYANSKQECIDLCAFTLKKFKENNFFCKLEKCLFFPEEFEYLGYIISYNNIKPISGKLVNLKPCKKLVEYQQLMGFINYFRNYIPKFTEKTINIRKGLSAPTTSWNNNMQKELDFFISFIPKLPCLAPFKPNQDVFILTDASEYGIGASIFQTGDKKIHIEKFLTNKIYNNENNVSRNVLDNVNNNQLGNESEQDISRTNSGHKIRSGKKNGNSIPEDDNKLRPIKPQKSCDSNNLPIKKEKKRLFKAEKKKLRNQQIPPIIELDKVNNCYELTKESYDKLMKELKPIGYYSRTLNATEQKYSTFDRELLALSETLQHYNLLLRNGQRIYSATDHKNLVIYINSESKVETNGKLRLRESICQYNITPIYIKGKDNQIADFLSRQVTNNNSITQTNHLITMKRNFKTEDYSIDQEIREFQENLKKISEECLRKIENLTQNILKLNQEVIQTQQQNLVLSQKIEAIGKGKDAVGDRVNKVEETIENFGEKLKDVNRINELNSTIVNQATKLVEKVELGETERKSLLLDQTKLFESRMLHLKDLGKKIVAAKHLRSDLKPGSKRHPLPMLVESLRESIKAHGWLYRDIPENTENQEERESHEETGLEEVSNENASNLIIEIPAAHERESTNEEITEETERRIQNAVNDIIVIEDEPSSKRIRRN